MELVIVNEDREKASIKLTEIFAHIYMNMSDEEKAKIEKEVRAEMKVEEIQ